jgi:hypothetical protein
MRARAAARDGERRRKVVLALGCPIHHGESTGTKSTSTSTRTQHGGRRSSDDDARRGGAVDRGGTTPTTPLLRYGAQRRKRAAPTGSSPCGEAPGDLHGDGRAADRATHGGGATRVCGSAAGARRYGLGEGSGAVRGSGAI